MEICDEGPDKTVTVKPHMSLRICLSLHARTYDPLGWVLPLRMHGNLLFRETLQFLKKDKKGGIPWDEHINHPELITKWNRYFRMLLDVDLSNSGGVSNL